MSTHAPPGRPVLAHARQRMASTDPQNCCCLQSLPSPSWTRLWALSWLILYEAPVASQGCRSRWRWAAGCCLFAGTSHLGLSPPMRRSAWVTSGVVSSRLAIYCGTEDGEFAVTLCYQKLTTACRWIVRCAPGD